MVGVLLVVVCAAGFVFVSLNAGDRRAVLALARLVQVGQVLTTPDLRQVSVAVDAGVAVVDAAQANQVLGRAMATSLPAGALLVAEAVSGASLPGAGQAIAALSLKAGQFPPEIAPGAHVLVVVVSGPDAGPPSAVPSGPAGESAGWPAVVIGVSVPPNEQVTVVSVQVGEATARQVAAVPAGRLSVVLVSAGGR
jgi:hypothetical protein